MSDCGCRRSARCPEHLGLVDPLLEAASTPGSPGVDYRCIDCGRSWDDAGVVLAAGEATILCPCGRALARLWQP